MLSMSGRVPSGIAIRRNKNVPVAALIGLLLTFFALPLCRTFSCTMPCCEDSGEPIGVRYAMPAPACGSECSVRAVSPASTEVSITPGSAYVLPLPASRALSQRTPSSSAGYSPFRYSRSNARPLYVVNDAFLI